LRGHGLRTKVQRGGCLYDGIDLLESLRYRLSRIEKCTGRDLSSMADRADFYVALRADDPRLDSRPRDSAVDRIGQPR